MARVDEVNFSEFHTKLDEHFDNVRRTSVYMECGVKVCTYLPGHKEPCAIVAYFADTTKFCIYPLVVKEVMNEVGYRNSNLSSFLDHHI